MTRRRRERDLRRVSMLVAALCTFGGAWVCAAHAAPPPRGLPAPAPTVASDIGQLRRALANPQGQGGALSAMARPDARTLIAARNAGHGQILAGVAADPSNPFNHRLRALRLTPMYRSPPAMLLLHLGLSETTPAATALAREAARALAAMGRADMLVAAAHHPDPEVRAYALGAGANPGAACTALGAAPVSEAPPTDSPSTGAPSTGAPSTGAPTPGPAVSGQSPAAPGHAPTIREPWPFVRRAAALGLSAATGVGACIAAALADSEPSVVEAAVMVAGESGLADLRPPLLALAGRANAPVTLRAEAVVALARLGDPAPAQRILQTHRAKGGIEPLALGAIRAFIELNDPQHTSQLVDLTEKSKSAAVRMAATEALLALQPDAADVLLRRRIGQARDPGERRQLEALRDRRGAALEPVPEDSPREDDEPD